MPLSSASREASRAACGAVRMRACTAYTARAAWIAARPSYQQSEVFRFGNAIVDDWEGRVNAWPLDEGLIDYTAADASRSYAVRPAPANGAPVSASK